MASWFSKQFPWSLPAHPETTAAAFTITEDRRGKATVTVACSTFADNGPEIGQPRQSPVQRWHRLGPQTCHRLGDSGYQPQEAARHAIPTAAAAAVTVHHESPWAGFDGTGTRAYTTRTGPTFAIHASRATETK